MVCENTLGWICECTTLDTYGRANILIPFCPSTTFSALHGSQEADCFYGALGPPCSYNPVSLGNYCLMLYSHRMTVRPGRSAQRGTMGRDSEEDTTDRRLFNLTRRAVTAVRDMPRRVTSHPTSCHIHKLSQVLSPGRLFILVLYSEVRFYTAIRILHDRRKTSLCVYSPRLEVYQIR